MNMKSLKQEFEAYLEKIGRLEPVTLGDDDKHQVVKEDSQFLIQLLNQHMKSNNFLLVLSTLILCISFGLAIFFLLSYRQNPEVIKLVSGGAIIMAPGIVCIRWLYKFWIQRTFIAISLTILNKMPPEQAADAMTHLYWNFIRHPYKPPGKQRAKDEGTAG